MSWPSVARRCPHEHCSPHRRFVVAPVRGEPPRSGVAADAGTACRALSPHGDCDDADAIHALIVEHLAEGHLLPRDATRSPIARASIRRGRRRTDRVVGCADLAPLSRRSRKCGRWWSADGARSCGVGRRLVDELRRARGAAGFETLCAFTHAPGYFVQLGFSIVPHVWLPEKIDADCRTCAQFRQLRPVRGDAAA